MFWIGLVHARVFDIVGIGAQIKAHDRHPCIHFYIGAGHQLPSDLTKQVFFHGQMAIGEIEFFGHTIAIFIGISL